jgi:anti-sigma regulatory factor (Ser/Thr protein kinase)
MRDGYRHEALPYRGHAEFVSASVGLARDGLERDERMIFLAAAAKLADVRDALGSDADAVTFVDTDEHGRNPSRITTLLDNFQAAGNGRRGLGVNELVFAGRSPASLREAQFAESVLNTATLQHWPLSLVCLYDCLTLDDESVAEMRRTHPVVHGEPGNPAYDPQRAGALFAAALPAPPGAVEGKDVGSGQLAEMREFVRQFGARGDLAPDRVDDLVLAANEIVTNSLRYGGGRCTLALWQEAGSVVCEVRDAGVIRDPLVGRLAPPPASSAGRGLWLANHLCDLVQIRSSQAGTVVRLHVDR